MQRLTTSLLVIGALCTGASARADVAPPHINVAPVGAKKAAKKGPEKPILVSAEARAKATAYTDGKSHYLVVVPDERSVVRLYYGDGKRLFRVPIEGHGMASGWDFQDPRFMNKTANPDFRGIDWRLMSAAKQDDAKKTLEVRCGERTATFTRVAEAAERALIDGASYEQTLRRFRPYALARDNTGVYYYVDRGYDEEDPTAPKNFRLFVGQRGNLKQQKMTNVVSDSQGDIFSTKTGDLRLVLSKTESEWVESGKSRKLLWVEPMQNLHMIFTELGVYIGERLGTPCDDL